MGTWEVRLAEGGSVAAGPFGDRVDAIARGLRLRVESSVGCRIAGPDEPSCVTTRDLYVRLVDAGVRIHGSGRDLAGFLRGWRRVGRALAGREWLDADEVAAMVIAAGEVDPGVDDPAWRVAEYEFVEEPATFADWEAIVLSQLADLADFAAAGPLEPWASFGVDTPRAQGCRRASGLRWYNFDPRTYLECGVAGTLGGRDEGDGGRIGWDVLAELARCGQEYE